MFIHVEMFFSLQKQSLSVCFHRRSLNDYLFRLYFALHITFTNDPIRTSKREDDEYKSVVWKFGSVCTLERDWLFAILHVIHCAVSIWKFAVRHFIEIMLMNAHIDQFIKRFSMIFATFRFWILIHIFEEDRFKQIKIHSRKHIRPIFADGIDWFLGVMALQHFCCVLFCHCSLSQSDWKLIVERKLACLFVEINAIFPWRFVLRSVRGGWVNQT